MLCSWLHKMAVSMHLKNVCFTIPISTGQKIYSLFLGMKILSVLLLAFGSSPALRIFTKIMKAPITVSSRWNLVWCVGKIEREVKQNIIDTRSMIANLAFVKIDKKFVFDLAQNLEHRRIVIDSVSINVSLIESNFNRLKTLRTNIVSESSGLQTICYLGEFLRFLEAYSTAVQYGQCFCKKCTYWKK